MKTLYLKDKVVIVQPAVNFDNGTIYYQGKNPVIKKQNPKFSPEKMIVLPLFDFSDQQAFSKSEFEKSLKEGKVLGSLKQPWSREKDDYPEAVLWKNRNELTLYSGITAQSNTSQGIAFQIDSGTALKKINILPSDNSWFSQEYPFESIVFISSDAFNEKLDEVEGVYDTEDKEVIKIENSSILTENDYLTRLKAILARKKLFFKDEDLLNFHTAMKSEGLVILSGLSGTGKSKLTSAYANALEIPDKYVAFIPVRPYWADDSDLIGYADTVNSVYRPGDSGLVDVLVDAENNPNQLYMVVFDEMNLARVEHYFSQFLSVLEMESGKREIRIYNEELEERMYNKEKYHAKISIGDNVLFVGTVNTDESTFQFSDKVLDRANVIELNMIPFFEETSTKALDDAGEEVGLHDKEQRVNVSIYNSFKGQSPQNILTKEERKMLWDIHSEINDVDKNVGIGWRVVTQIDNYLKNLPDNDNFSRSKALDLQLVQRVWTKVRGSEEQMKGLLGEFTENETFKPGSLEAILNRYSDSSEFSVSRKILKRKAKDLGVYGFTI